MSKVREITRARDITPLPNLPGYVKGVINLRGRIIPVTALRLKLGAVASPTTDSTCIVIVQTQVEVKGQRIIGAIVDGVEEVVNVIASQIEPAPDYGVLTGESNILGMAKINNAVKVLLDIDRVLVN